MSIEFRETMLPAAPRGYNSYTLGDGNGTYGLPAWATTVALDSDRLLVVRVSGEEIILEVDEREIPLHFNLPSDVSGRPDIALKRQYLVLSIPCSRMLCKVIVDTSDLSIFDVKTIQYPYTDGNFIVISDAGSFGATDQGTVYVLDERGRSEEIFDKVKNPERRGTFLSGRLFGGDKKSQRDKIIMATSGEDSNAKSTLFVSAAGILLVWHLRSGDRAPSYLRYELKTQISSLRKSDAAALDGSTFLLACAADQEDSGPIRVFVVNINSHELSVSEKPLPRGLLSDTVAGVGRVNSNLARIVLGDGLLLHAQRTGSVRVEKLWSFVDDLGEEGCWKRTDELVSSIEDLLFTPRRFTDSSIAKALQLPPNSNVSRKELVNLVREFIEEQKAKDEKNTDESVIALILRRATTAQLATETEIVGVGVAPQGMTTFIRPAGVSVIRPCLLEERQYLSAPPLMTSPSEIVSMSATTAKGAWAWIVAASAALQVASCSDQEASAGIPILRRPSDGNFDMSLAVVAARYVQENMERQGDDVSAWSFEECIQEIVSTMLPSQLLLRFLIAIREYGTLAEAAARTLNTLPASSQFAAGLSALSDYKSRVERSIEHPFSQEQADLIADQVLDMFLAGAAALEEMPNEEDVETVKKLISLQDLEGAESEKLEYWFRERVVRIFESVHALRSAATAAVDAMQFASTRRSYEIMRSVVFQRFLDIGDLEKALAAILYPPFQASDEADQHRVSHKDFWTEDEVESASALRDMIANITNAVVSAGKLEWFASCALPESVSVAVKAALLRIARSSDVIATVSGPKSAYEDVMAWDMVRGDIAGVAEAAYEWSRRLLEERVNGTRLEFWTRARSRSLSAALSALKLLPPQQQIISKIPSRGTCSINVNNEMNDDSLMAIDTDAMKPEVDFSQLSLDEMFSTCAGYTSKAPVINRKVLERSCLLANAQEVIVARDTFNGAEPPLDESLESVEFAISRLCSYQQVESAARLAVCWVEAFGNEKPTIQVAKATAGTAALHERWDFLLLVVEILHEWPRRTYNYFAVALEGVLSSGNGSASPPQWLIEGACGNGSSGMVLTVLLRYGFTKQALTLLLAKMKERAFVTSSIDTLISQVDNAHDKKLIQDAVAVPRTSETLMGR